MPHGCGVAAETGMFSAVSLMMGIFGVTAIAGHQIAINLASLTFMVPMGLSIAISIRVGLMKGKSNFKEAQIVQIDGDGDCGYESVSYALKDLYKKKNKDIPTGSELRQLVGLNPLKPPNLNKATFEKARKRSKNNEWAENDELAILAYLYNTCIVVYQSGVSATFDRWSIIMPDVNECEKDQTIYLYNTKRLHFDVLVNLKPV